MTAIEALGKNLALKCNAKRNGGLSLLTVLDVKFEHVPDDWRVSARYRDKGRQGSHVKRVMTRFDTPCVNFLKEFKTARPNASYNDFVMTAEPARDQVPEWDGQANTLERFEEGVLIFTHAVPKERKVTIGPGLLQQFPKGFPQREVCQSSSSLQVYTTCKMAALSLL